ncbi:MAG: transposase [Xanthomonadaceae bacterium]|nr:transposase [Xanthomonadaceae bacterium]
MKFLMRLDQGENMSTLCREFGISRKTGYKFLERYKLYGIDGLSNQKRSPITKPFKMPESVEFKVLELKERYPDWGARKIRERLPSAGILGCNLPSIITVHRILRRHGKVERKKQRLSGSTAFRSEKIRSTSAPNQIWGLDFKGQFRTRDGKLCYPLTLSDHFSRYLLLCEALEGAQTKPAEIALSEVFHLHGLPDAILSDNGSPFGSQGLFKLSRLSVWFMRLGIEVMRIEPGHPEQNGRHERIHLTLKRATTRPAANNLFQQQERFDRFIREYNDERPHEALNMKTPASVWTQPNRKMPATLPEPDYKAEDLIREPTNYGQVHLQRGKMFTLNSVFTGQPIALTEVEEKLWRIRFMNYEIGFFDEAAEMFKPNTYLTLLPMS